MRKYFMILVCSLLYSLHCLGQKGTSGSETLAKSIYQILSQHRQPKDSLSLYALNFELIIEKNATKTTVVKIVANDSLAYQLFPAYEKLRTINFSALVGDRKRSRLIIPILIYGSSGEKIKYRDEQGRAMINFNAAVNAIVALNDPNVNYDNLKDAYTPVSQRLHGKSDSSMFLDAIYMKPFLIEIMNIK